MFLKEREGFQQADAAAVMMDLTVQSLARVESVFIPAQVCVCTYLCVVTNGFAFLCVCPHFGSCVSVSYSRHNLHALSPGRSRAGVRKPPDGAAVENRSVNNRHMCLKLSPVFQPMAATRARAPLRSNVKSSHPVLYDNHGVIAPK